MRLFAIVVSLGRCLATAIRHPQPAITLDLLRSELSHETAAKIARLSALAAQWRLGRYEPDDPADAARILTDLEAIPLRHACRAAARFSTLAAVVGLLATIRGIRAILRPLGRSRVLTGSQLDELVAEIEAFRHRARTHAERLTRPHAAQLGGIVREATDQIRREVGGGLVPGSVGIELLGAEGAGNTWVSRTDAERWRDILRNLVRNAVQATTDALAPSTPGEHVPSVRVHLASGRPSGSVIEVEDHGMGMDPATVDRIWQAGTSRRGSNHGQGLTEEKHAFLRSRASLEVRTAPGVGTVFRIEVPARDIALPAVSAVQLRPVYLPLAILLLVTATVAALRPQAPIASVECIPPNVVRAIDTGGKVRWFQNLGEEVVNNNAYPGWTPLGQHLPETEQLLVRSGAGKLLGTVVATQPPLGPGHIWFITSDGNNVRGQPIRWAPPRSKHLGKLICWWRALAPWSDGRQDVVALHIRDNRYAASSTQFFDFHGDSLGAYYHPGHLTPCVTDDFDGDGRAEMLLFGINNPAQYDTSFISVDPLVYCACVVLLEPPDVSGQAWPYSAWADMPGANEEGYLILPPLRVGQSSEIVFIDIGARSGRETPFEIVTADGRIYQTDTNLRPISCGTGDFTVARGLAPVYPLAPCLWIHHGKRESIDIEVGGVKGERPTARKDEHAAHAS